jgi:hypothetical protein
VVTLAAALVVVARRTVTLVEAPRIRAVTSAVGIRIPVAVGTRTSRVAGIRPPVVADILVVRRAVTRVVVVVGTLTRAVTTSPRGIARS